MRPADGGDTTRADTRGRRRWARALPTGAAGIVAALIVGAMLLAGGGDFRIETSPDVLSALTSPIVAAMLSVLSAALALFAWRALALKIANRRL
jgi:hypothetical protein